MQSQELGCFLILSMAEYVKVGSDEKENATSKRRNSQHNDNIFGSNYWKV